MKADISRRTFDARKSYTGVRMQQGRIQVDADWNEQLDIQHYRQRLARTDTIGATGVPRGGLDDEEPGGFRVSIIGEGKQLVLTPGRIYVDGILCELDPDDEARQTADPLGLNQGGADAVEPGAYLVYLDVWERAISAAEDPEIVDPALLVGDTTVRSKVEWQVRAEPVVEEPSEEASNDPCQATLSGKIRRDGRPKMTAYTEPSEREETPCLVPSQSGYRGIENQLYRVEVHRGSGQGAPTIKWSRDNAAVTFGVEAFTGTTVRVRDPGRDANFELRPGDLVEVVSAQRQARGEGPGPLARVSRPRDQAAGTTNAQFNRQFELTSVDGDQLDAIREGFNESGDQVFLRRWDHGADQPDAKAVPVELDEPVTLEKGIVVDFDLEDAGLRSGDYWLIPARASNDRRAAGDILWPHAHGDSNTPEWRPPRGVDHHYAALALVEITGPEDPSYAPYEGQQADCRERFPPLNDLRADDIGYDSKTCADLQDANTVQQALDELCGRLLNPCDFIIHPKLENWREQLHALMQQRLEEDEPHLHICIAPGSYNLRRPLRFEGWKHVSIAGVGESAKFSVLKGRTALSFKGCESVVLESFGAQAGVASGEPSGLSGVIRLESCGRARLTDLDLGCAASWVEQTSCVYAYGVTSDGVGVDRTDLEVRDCRMSVGHGQLGIAAIGIDRLDAHNNRIEVRGWSDGAELSDLASRSEHADKFRAVKDQFVDRLFQHVAHEMRDLDDDYQYARVAYPDGQASHNMWFVTDPMMGEIGWQEVIDAAEATDVGSGKKAIEYLRQQAARMIFEREGWPSAETEDAWKRWVEQVHDIVKETPFGRGGVVVGGRACDRVRLRDNTIRGFSRGVHVGLGGSEHPEKADAAPRECSITGNDINVRVPYGYNRERHGIYVGHFQRLNIAGNHLRATTVRYQFPARTDGIRVYGRPGPHMLIKDNYAQGFEPGIHTVFLRRPEDQREDMVWSVVDNHARCRLMRLAWPDSSGHDEVWDEDVFDVRNRPIS